MNAANDPRPPVPTMKRRPRGHQDLLDTIMSALTDPANDNQPRTLWQTISAIKKGAIAAAVPHRPE